MKKSILGLLFALAVMSFGASTSALSETCICTMEYAPECGVDGVTYGNACGRECQGVELDYKGECGTDPVVVDEAIPTTCVSWYDGCNTCMVDNGSLGSCTKLACIRQAPSYCAAHEFEHLTDNQVMIVDSAVTKYFTNYTGEIKADKKKIIIDRIEKKRTTIMDILMRSKFSIGSPELAEYQLILEILDALDSAIRKA